MSTASKDIKIFEISTVHQAHDPRVVHRIAQTLSKKYDVHVLIPAANQAAYPNLRLHSLPNPARLMNRIFVSQWQVLKLIIKHKPAILHLHDPELLPLGLLFWMFGKVIVYDVHEDPKGQFGREKPFIKKIFKHIYLLFLACIKQCGYIILAEDSYAKHFRKVQNNRLVVVRNFPVITNFLPYKVQWDANIKKNIFYIGRIHKEREIHTLLDAMLLLQKKGHSIGLKLIGLNAEGEACLKGYAAWNEIANSIQTFPVLPHEKAFYEAQSCFVGIALLNATENYANSYPSKLFEYMAIGLPVISSKLPLCEAVIDQHKTGFTVANGKVSALVDALERLYLNQKLAQEMGERGVIAVETAYNWEYEASRLMIFFDTLVKSKKFRKSI